MANAQNCDAVSGERFGRQPDANWLRTVYMLQVMWPISLLTILLRTGYLYQLAALALLLIHR